MNPSLPLQQLLFTDRYRHLWSRTVPVKRNEYLVRTGEKCPWLFFVETGSVRVMHEAGGEEATIRFGYGGSLISVLPSFLNDVPAGYAIQALKAGRLKAMHRKDLLAAVHGDETLSAAWRSGLEQLILEQLEREIDLLTPLPADRYRRVLGRSPRLFQEIPNKYIASYLRMTPETLSRLKKS